MFLEAGPFGHNFDEDEIDEKINIFVTSEPRKYKFQTSKGN